MNAMPKAKLQKKNISNVKKRLILPIIETPRNNNKFGNVIFNKVTDY